MSRCAPLVWERSQKHFNGWREVAPEAGGTAAAGLWVGQVVAVQVTVGAEAVPEAMNPKLAEPPAGTAPL